MQKTKNRFASAGSKSVNRRLAHLMALAGTKPYPDEEWECRLVGSAGSCRSFEANLRFKLRFGPDVVVGHGRGLDFPDETEEQKFRTRRQHLQRRCASTTSFKRIISEEGPFYLLW